jgi:hypothetical protein
MKVEVNVEYPELIRPVPYEAFSMSLDVHLSSQFNFSFLIYEPCITYVIICLNKTYANLSIFLI